MDLKTIQAANRVREFQEGDLMSPDIAAKLAEVKDLSDEEKVQLVVEAFREALSIAEQLTMRPEYDAERKILDLSSQGLGKIGLDIYHDDGDKDSNAFDALYVNPGDVYGKHFANGALIDGDIFVNRDGTITAHKTDGDELDSLVHIAIEYVETLEETRKALVPMVITT